MRGCDAWDVEADPGRPFPIASGWLGLTAERRLVWSTAMPRRCPDGRVRVTHGHEGTSSHGRAIPKRPRVGAGAEWPRWGVYTVGRIRLGCAQPCRSHMGSRGGRRRVGRHRWHGGPARPFCLYCGVYPQSFCVLSLYPCFPPTAWVNSPNSVQEIHLVSPRSSRSSPPLFVAPCLLWRSSCVRRYPLAFPERPSLRCQDGRPVVRQLPGSLGRAA